MLRDFARAIAEDPALPNRFGGRTPTAANGNAPPLHLRADQAVAKQQHAHAVLGKVGGWVAGWTYICMHVCLDGWMHAWISDQMDGRIYHM